MFWQSLFSRHALVKCFAGIVALQVFNSSVAPPDLTSNERAEDLSVNNMESVVEIVLEKFLGIDNAIAEHGAQKTHPKNFAWKPVFDPAFGSRTRVTTCWNATAEHLVGAPVCEDKEGRHRPEPSAPPPKA